ncbi:hypothetical protein OAM09_04310 [Candidatus Pelagibacter sp.]|nr:hypothetical protein [Candidatus Pelagibacter sp.]
MDEKQKKIVIKDYYDSSEGAIIWNENKEEKNCISVLNFLEHNSDIIKKEYHNIINNIENINLKTKKLYEELYIVKNFSSLWSSDFFEKSIYKNPSIILQLKLIALNKILKKINPEKVLLHVESDEEKHCIILLCKKLNINFSLNSKNLSSVSKIYLSIFAVFSFIKFFKFLYERLSFKKINFKKIKNLKNTNLFVSYSAYTDHKKIRNGKFDSSYWKPIINNEKLFKNTVWCNIYFNQKNTSINKQIKNLKNLNTENNYFFFLEQLFDLKIFFCVIFFWFRNLSKAKTLITSINSYLKNIDCEYLKNLITKDFLNSFIGIESFSNYYYFFLFQKLSKNNLEFNKIFYLFENQGWEKSLIFNFKKKSKLYAVNHASIRYWDLRFYYNSNLKDELVPDYYAVNGEDSLKKLIDENFPYAKLIKLEALRYYSLMSEINSFKTINFKKKKILLVTDYQDVSNNNLLKALRNLNKEVKDKFKFTVKEHSLKKFSPQNINYERSNLELKELRNSHDIAIVTNTTSAIIDLNILDFYVISILDKKSINLSPMRNNKNILFINDYSKISKILMNPEKYYSTKNLVKDYFYYDKNLTKWKDVLIYASK